MATSVLQQVGSLLLLALEARALDCNQIVRLQGNEIGRTQGLLKAMGEKSSPQDWPEDPDFGFPMESIVLNSRVEEAKLAVGFILEQVQIIFQQNFTQAGWNLTATDFFQKTLDQQQSRWKRCFTARTGKQATSQGYRVKRTLKVYFAKLHRFLREKEYSFCAWEVVREEIFNIYSLVISKLLGKL